MRHLGPCSPTFMTSSLISRCPGAPHYRERATKASYSEILVDGVVRLAWTLGPKSAEAPIEGSDVIVLADGKIKDVIGFLDKVPQ